MREVSQGDDSKLHTKGRDSVFQGKVKRRVIKAVGATKVMVLTRPGMVGGGGTMEWMAGNGDK